MAKTNAGAAGATGGSKPKATSKTVIFQKLADATKLSKKQVTEFFAELTKLIKNELSKKGPGVFTLPGLLKLQRKEKAATKARKGRNPQTGEEITIKAKPKRTVVRASPLKDIRDMFKS
jgi:nucleoid DNA-binding protein